MRKKRYIEQAGALAYTGKPPTLLFKNSKWWVMSGRPYCMVENAVLTSATQRTLYYDGDNYGVHPSGAHQTEEELITYLMRHI